MEIGLKLIFTENFIIQTGKIELQISCHIQFFIHKLGEIQEVFAAYII